MEFHQTFYCILNKIMKVIREQKDSHARGGGQRRMDKMGSSLLSRMT